MLARARCGKPGHFIAACPTNGDPKFDKPAHRMRPVGIPKSMLKKVAPPPSEGAEADASRSGLVDRDGSLVTMVAYDTSFFRATERKKDHLEAVSVPDELKCPVTKQLFRNAVLLPCCGAGEAEGTKSLPLDLQN